MDEKKLTKQMLQFPKKMIKFLKIAKFQKVIKSLKNSKYEWKFTIILEDQVKMRGKTPFKPSNWKKDHVHQSNSCK